MLRLAAGLGHTLGVLCALLNFQKLVDILYVFCLVGAAAKIICVFFPGNYAALNIIDIDKDNGNPQMCASYVAEIYTNLMASEVC
jgi:hypothetical protein